MLNFLSLHNKDFHNIPASRNLFFTFLEALPDSFIKGYQASFVGLLKILWAFTNTALRVFLVSAHCLVPKPFPHIFRFLLRLTSVTKNIF